MKQLLFIFAICLALPSCTTFATERGIRQTASDKSIKMQVLNLWRHSKMNIYSDLEIMVHEGRVMAIGRLPTTKEQIEAVHLAWKVKGVSEVIDEITVGPPMSVSEFTRDSWMSAQLRTELLFTDNIRSQNFDFVTYASRIYLIGIADSTEELDLVLQAAQNISGVKEVINHIRLKEAQKLEADPLE